MSCVKLPAPWLEPRRRFIRHLIVSCLVGTSVSAHAVHRQTPPVVALTTAGDVALPRVPAGLKTIALAVPAGTGHKIVTVSPWANPRDPATQTLVAASGDHANPAVSFSGRVVAFDTTADLTGGGPSGRQIVARTRKSLVVLSNDPSGTSANPAVDASGKQVVFESEGDLAGTGTPGVRQVYLRDAEGTISQVSAGLGTSGNAVISARRGLVAFESTSDPRTGADTGVSQVWLADLRTGSAYPITAGLGPSGNPAISNDGRLVVFESTADLAADVPVDTGVYQIFAYDTRTATYARITDDPFGCRLPSAYKTTGDWRIAFVCSERPYFFMLRRDQRFLLQADGGATQRVAAQLGVHFVVVSTRADLLNGGATAGKQVYLVNLFKRPAQPVAGTARWFPRRGIPPL